jgi:hypothetical protein
MKITVVPPAVRVFTIEMSEEEARTLKYICGKFTGSGIYSRRKHTDDIYVQLDSLGVKKVATDELDGWTFNNSPDTL